MRKHVALAFSLALVVGCTTTTVKQNPGKHDRGIRYYRPKPYLLVQPTPEKSDDFVSISLEYLPDFSEEYSIRARAGLGINKTKITLKDGWNLTQIDQELDSQTDENITAMSELIKSVGGLPGLGKPTAGASRMAVRANNVPLGYYESVVSRGPDNKKRLYGWRYVGFAPFNACPTEMHGLNCADCNSSDLYGMVMRRGTMTFVPIREIPWAQDLAREAVAAGASGDTSGPTLMQIVEDNKDTLLEAAQSAFSDEFQGLSPVGPIPIVPVEPDVIEFTMTLPNGTAQPGAEVSDRIAKSIKNSVSSTIADLAGPVRCVVKLKVAETATPPAP